MSQRKAIQMDEAVEAFIAANTRARGCRPSTRAARRTYDFAPFEDEVRIILLPLRGT